MEKINLNINFEAPRKSQYYITGLIKHLVDEFDKEGTAKKLAAKHFNDPASKYYGMTADQIVEQWTKAADAAVAVGNALDDYVGLVTEPEKMAFTRDKWLDDVNYKNNSAVNKRCYAWTNYWDSMTQKGWKMVGREVPLFYTVNPGVTVGGRADMIIYNGDLDTIAVIDWKTTDEINGNKFTKPMKCPLVEGLYQDKATQYGLQTAFYKMALKEILPAELKDTKITTMIVQVRSDGTIAVTEDNIKLSIGQIILLLTWCIHQIKECNICDAPANTNMQAPTTSFKDELAQLLSKYSISPGHNPNNVADFIVKTLTNINELYNAGN